MWSPATCCVFYGEPRLTHDVDYRRPGRRNKAEPRQLNVLSRCGRSHEQRTGKNLKASVLVGVPFLFFQFAPLARKGQIA